MSRQWRELIDAETLACYDERIAQLLPAEALAWAHCGWLGLTP